MRPIQSAALVALASVFSFVPNPARGEETVLTLQEAIHRAMSGNPGITAAAAGLDASEHRVYEARAGFLPQASLSASYRRATQNQALPPWMNVSDASGSISKFFARESMDSFDNFAFSLNVSQLVWDFGRTSGTLESAKSLRDASAFDLKTARESLWLQVTQSYFTVLATQELVSAADETRKQMKKHLELARAQAEAGVRQRIDVTRAAADLSSAELSLVKAANAHRLARLALNSAMGVAEDAPYRVQRPPGSEVVKVDSLDQEVQEALLHRPEVQALKKRVQATAELVRLAKSAWYPTIAANGRWSHMGYQIDDLPYNWGVGATLTWNVFSGLQTTHSVQEAEATLRAQQALLEQYEIAVRTEVESVALSYREALDKIAPVKSMLESARETLYLAEGRYSAGTGGIVEVTDAQAILTQARVGMIQAEYDIEIARARLLKALGTVPGPQGE
jgi:outer membrane protein